MRLWSSFTLLGILVIGSACSPLGQKTAPTAVKTNSAPPTSIQTPEPSGPPLPTFTPLHTSMPNPEPIDGPLYSWPIPPLSEEQIQEVLDCQKSTRTGSTTINPKDIEIEDPVTACDFGLKALSLVVNFDTMELPDLGIYYAQQALLLNPGILFTNHYFFFAFADLNIVESPVSIDRTIQEIKINYSWRGIGAPVDFSLTITNEGMPRAVGSVEIGHDIGEDENTKTTWTFQQELASELLEGVGSSMINLIPVKRQGMMYACFDNYPDWEIEITFDDGNQTNLFSNESNFFWEGGPFQTKIKGQNYVMASYEFNVVLNKIIEKLELPYGQTLSMFCNPYPVAEGLFTDLPVPDYFP